MGTIDDRLRELGITLPEVPAPVAAYVPAVQAGDLVFLHPWYVHLVWDYYAGRAEDRLGHPLPPLETIHLPEVLLEPEQILEQHGEAMRGRRRVFLILAHEETEDPDDYYGALLRAMGRVWIAEGRQGEGVKPILFHLSWGVRVAVFTRK